MQTEPDLKGLRVAVTGGTSGLGLALVQHLSKRGAQVVLVARTPERVELVARQSGSVGLVGDVGKKDDIYPLALQITGQLGGLDVLINNASSLGPARLKPLADTECEEFEHALAINLLGPFRLTRALFGALAASARDGHGGLVVNITSDAAVNAYPAWGAYGAAKAGLTHMSNIWDQEAQDQGIRFIAVDSGDMDTPLHAAAVPDADKAELKDPSDAASEIIDRIGSLLDAPRGNDRRARA